MIYVSLLEAYYVNLHLSLFIQLAVLLERNTSKYSAVIQLLLDKSIITADYDDISEHVGDVNEF